MSSEQYAYIRENLLRVRDRIATAANSCGRNFEDITLITVTKTYPAAVLQAVIDAGCRDIGENKVQEIVEKKPGIHDPFTMHLIGHLQSNKVGKAVLLSDWIHSVDSFEIAQSISRHCEKIAKRMSICIQVNTSGEDTKSGIDPEKARELFEQCLGLPHITCRGFMTIGLLDATESQTRSCFARLRSIRESCAQIVEYPLDLSMGMSSDFSIAIEEGATMVRIGSDIVGKRFATL